MKQMKNIESDTKQKVQLVKDLHRMGVVKRQNIEDLQE